jgi:hypothetical protein
VIRVTIDMERFWRIGQPVHQHVYVGTTLKNAGVPVVGGLEIQGVEHGRLLHYNEVVDGKKFRVYEWTPGPDSRKAPLYTDEDDEL